MPETQPADERALGRLTRRREFLAVAGGSRAHSELITLQSYRRPEGGDDVRVGLTVTRKAGGAVERNRMRRRLRAALRLAGPELGRSGHDYVIIARTALLSASFDHILSDLKAAFVRVHAPRSGAHRGRPSGPRHTERADDVGKP
ncbi:ribonuclease P protein component [Terrihabitans sp. B22-R8]|uniref:ribonuclease P protein component n=1 Tax=Terrihabitans sp. B22-R8 TaxID=3425128 RepID=UPI00403C4322